MSAERLTGMNKTDDMYPNATIRIPRVVIIIGTDASLWNVQGRRRMARHTPVAAIATAIGALNALTPDKVTATISSATAADRDMSDTAL